MCQPLHLNAPGFLAVLLQAKGIGGHIGEPLDGAVQSDLACGGVQLELDDAIRGVRLADVQAVAKAALADAFGAEAPEVRVLVLTTYADDDAVLPALRAGAAGYLTKDTTGEALLAAIRTVAAGGSVLDAAVQRRLVDLAGAPAAPPPEPELPEGLTAREIDVLRLVAQGLSNARTASRLVVSEATVKTHVNHLISKLGVDGRPALVAWAWRHGVVRAG